MSASLAAPPLTTSLVEPPENPKSPDAAWTITRAWNNWLLSLTTRVQQSATVLISPTVLTGQSASIAPTALALGTIAAGYYRVAWFARVTTAATTSSSLTVTISFTESGIACTRSGTAMTGNTTGTNQGNVELIKADQSTAISYSATYASVGGTVMVYRLSILAELVS